MSLKPRFAPFNGRRPLSGSRASTSAPSAGLHKADRQHPNVALTTPTRHGKVLTVTRYVVVLNLSCTHAPGRRGGAVQGRPGLACGGGLRCDQAGPGA